jgi:hypothetical protein
VDDSESPLKTDKTRVCIGQPSRLAAPFSEVIVTITHEVFWGIRSHHYDDRVPVPFIDFHLDRVRVNAINRLNKPWKAFRLVMGGLGRCNREIGEKQRPNFTHFHERNGRQEERRFLSTFNFSPFWISSSRNCAIG